jgi:D-alanyl-lipoteichoic acid acyltransferase DltB (MBOAT superfamily)
VPKYFYILLAITIIAYFAGRYLESHPKRYTVAIALVIILAPLLFFKYCDFVVYNVNDLLHTFGIDNNFRALKLIAPLGISFFTFQAYGYVYDVYKRKIAAERNMIDFMLFMAFFPQIASGPISKASELLPQIKILDILMKNS